MKLLTSVFLMLISAPAIASELKSVKEFYYVDSGPLHGAMFFAQSSARSNNMARLSPSGSLDTVRVGSNACDDCLYVYSAQSDAWVSVAQQNGKKYEFDMAHATYTADGYTITRPEYLEAGIFKNEPEYGTITLLK
jgi:hypothetical protein